MTDDDYHDVGLDFVEEIRRFGNASFIHPDSRREFRGALEEVEWCIEGAEDIPIETVRERVPVWEEALNKVLGQIDDLSEVNISVDDDGSIIFTAKE